MKDEEIKILCPFCNVPYTADMLIDLEDGDSGCDTCGHGAASLKIEIKCSNCQKVVYVKEGKSYDF